MQAPRCFIHVRVADQRLEVKENDVVVVSYPVSTAKNGVGELNGSGCTPRGWHRVRAKIGGDAPLNAVFVARRATAEVYSDALAAQFPARDWILTRILWLDGLEPGLNRYGKVNTASRYIYIHGSPDSGVAGLPQSHGCIRMTSAAVADLFDRVAAGTRVLIDG